MGIRWVNGGNLMGKGRDFDGIKPSSDCDGDLTGTGREIYGELYSGREFYGERMGISWGMGWE